MRKQDTENRERFVARMVKESNGAPGAEDLARLMLRHAVTHCRLQEAHCNGVGTWYDESNESFQKRQDRFEKYTEKRESQIEKRITAICAQLGFSVVFTGDPRGYTVHVTVPSGYVDHAGADGIGVPVA